MPVRTESRFIEISGNIIFGALRMEKGEVSIGRLQAVDRQGGKQRIGRCRLARKGGCEGVVAAASTEIMQLFHARAPVIGCTFAAEAANTSSSSALGRETLRRCPGPISQSRS